MDIFYPQLIYVDSSGVQGRCLQVYLRAAPLVMLSLADCVDISNGIESKGICIVQMFFLFSKKKGEC